MSDEPSSIRPGPPTAAWLDEQQRKREAYSASRRRHMERFMRHSQGEADDELDDQAEAIPTDSPAGPIHRRSRGKVHDPRQLNFEV